MKNIIVKFSLVVFISFSALYVHSQCTNTTLYPYDSAPAPTDNTPVTITTKQYEGDYNEISNVVAGETYQSSSDCDSYITVRRGTSNGTVVAHGWSPLSWTDTVSGTYYIHYNTNDTCGAGSKYCTTTITCTSCPPPNNLCTNATDLPCGTTNLAGTTINTSNIAHGTGCSISNYGVWYTFTGTGAETTISSTAASGFDHVMAIDSGSCGSLTNISCHDAAGAGGTETTTFTTTAGLVYYVYIASNVVGTTTGSFTISRTCGPPPVPDNDLCANATSLPCGSSNIFGTTLGATDIVHGTGCTMSNYGVWYSFVGDGQHTTVSSVAASGFDHELSISTGTCGNLSKIICKDNYYGGGGTETATFFASTGVQYYVYVAYYYGTGNTTGNFTISRTCFEVIEGSENCENAQAVCAEEGVGIKFGATKNSPAVSYPPDQCDYLVNPTWWYFQIESLGYIEMEIASSCGDVDFACYGPFDNITCDPLDLTGSGSYTWYDSENSGNTYTVTDPCKVRALALPSGNLVDAAYSESDTEILNINPVSVGEYYVVIIGNYDNCDGVIDFNQTNIGTPGAGSVDCDIVSDCIISSISATTACTGATFSVSGEIYFTDPPVDGTLTICEGAVCQTFTPPFVSPTSYTLTGLTADGLQHQLTGTFASDTTNCDKLSNYTAPFIPLPIDLIAFDVVCKDDAKHIRWTTLTEVNNHYFILEKSMNGFDFESIAQVQGEGNSNQIKHYNYQDNDLRSEVVYYRLSQTDFDGTTKAFPMIVADCSQEQEISIVPNPFKNTIHISGLFTDCLIDIYGARGEKIQSIQHQHSSMLEINLEHLSVGIYFVRIIDAKGMSKNFKIIKT